MKTTHASVLLSACVALGCTLGCSAQVDPAAQQADDSAREVAASDPHPSEGQARIANATLKLENTFSDQFVKGKIDRSALSGPIDDVVQAMPEAERPKVQAHIGHVLQTAEKAASEMTSDERAQVAAVPAPERIGETQQAQIADWGWPGAAGWGGYGAFGFPGIYSTGYSCNFESYSVNGWGTGGGYCTPY